MTELVSILIPAYNAAEWVSTAIHSCIVQSWPRIEVIVVDDGSRDETLARARAMQGPVVNVVTQPNQGAPAARNRALELAQGDFIQWLDADDLLSPHKIAAQMAVAHELSDPNVVLSCAFGTFYHRPSKAQFTPNALWRDLTPREYFLTRFNQNAFFQTAAWLATRSLTTATGLWTETDSPDDDGEYFCRMVSRSAGVKFVHDARTYYRVGNYGAVNNARSQRAQTALLRSKIKCIGYLRSIDDGPEARAACVQLLQDSLTYFCPERPDLFDEAQTMALSLGGSLEPPPLKWKYRPLEWMLGYPKAVATTRLLPRLRTRTARRWDQLISHLS